MTLDEAAGLVQRLVDEDCPEGHTGGEATVCPCRAHQAERVIASVVRVARLTRDA